MTKFETYRVTFPNARLSRKPNGVLEVVLHTDGVTDRWDLAAYPGLVTHQPVVVAATLLRDAGVRRDDAGVLVVKAAGA